MNEGSSTNEKSQKNERFTLIQDNIKLLPDPSKVFLTNIRSKHALNVNKQLNLGFPKGELNTVNSVIHRCTPIGSDDRLIIRRLECLSEDGYTQKIHELDLFERMSKHPNIVTLYSYWSEDPDDPDNPFVYKYLYLLFEECMVGDVQRTIVQNPLRPSIKTITKYICDLAKALALLHQSGLYHGGVRATNLFINSKNDLVLGPLKISNMESMMQNYHLLTKYNITRYIKLYYIYWAPEIFKQDKLDVKIDIWSLGVLAYLMVTGEYPFDIESEERTMKNIFTANLNWRPLTPYPMIEEMLRNILVIDPSKRWTAGKILTHCQVEFVYIIQKYWRGILCRRIFRYRINLFKKLQATIKSYLTRQQYKHRRYEIRWQAARLIQRNVRDFSSKRELRKQQKIITNIQAMIISKKIRRGYLKLRRDTLFMQS